MIDDIRYANRIKKIEGLEGLLSLELLNVADNGTRKNLTIQIYQT
jgi:hypothetical protein